MYHPCSVVVWGRWTAMVWAMLFITSTKPSHSYTWKIKNIHDQLLQFPVPSQFLINPHDQVNTSLGPRATKHSMMTPAQRQKAKVSRQLKAHKKKLQHQAQRSWGVFQARGKFRATKEETQVHVLEDKVHIWGTQFIKTPCGVAGTAGTRVSSIWKDVKCDSTVQVSKITSSLRVGSCKVENLASQQYRGQRRNAAG